MLYLDASKLTLPMTLGRLNIINVNSKTEYNWRSYTESMKLHNGRKCNA